MERAPAPHPISMLPRRPRERMAGTVFQVAARAVGFRADLLPEHMRRQLRIIGVTDEQLYRTLPRLRRLGEWPYVWEAEAHARAARGDVEAAFAAQYVAQRILITRSPLKDRLYRRAVELYARVPQPPLERLDSVNARGERIGVYLQLPEGASKLERPARCVLALPGITGTKEELHPYVMPLLRRGVAVARMDHPFYGETDGLVDHHALDNVRVVLAQLARDPRIDAHDIHVFAMSLGANIGTHGVTDTNARSLTVICPPFEPVRFLADLPTMNLHALQQMTGRSSLDELLAFARTVGLRERVRDLTIPVRIFHGGRDRTIPVREGIDLSHATAGPTALTIYERDHHNCLEHTDEIIAGLLEFIGDPLGVCERTPDIQHVDVAPTIHTTDRNARRAGAGEPPRLAPLRARLPFHLTPHRRPSP